MERRLVELLPRVGRRVARSLHKSPRGATTAAFEHATHTDLSPLSGYGVYRVGQSGRLCLLTKSEHYHVPVGHCFPGYELVNIARRLGVPNATHNNTRGHITRVLEEELVRAANANPRSRRALDRVLNLETGSLAAEAGLKLMLARFYQPQEDTRPCPDAGRIPVFIVLADDAGTPRGNYHGTTVIAQILRGMWPELADRLARPGLLRLAPVRPNNSADLGRAFARDGRGRERVAGLSCELVMMNYAARRLSESFVRQAADMCRKHDVPMMIDEIQTCLWSPALFMFREYGIEPDIVAIGKGFPGGEYPASRVMFNRKFDCLPQFGALVTNGQEELASLAYLVTMRWAAENADITAEIGDYYQARLEQLAGRFSGLLTGVGGRRHLSSLCFADLEAARKFVRLLAAGGLDISVQTYKADCPPSALTKLPLIAGPEIVEFVVQRIAAALSKLQ